MADKISLLTVESLENQTTALQVLNENFGLIASAFDNTLSRDGETPNTMLDTFDVNGERVINVGAPLAGSDAARLIDISDALAIDDLTLLPALQDGKVLSNDGDVLLWVEPSDLPGFGDMQGANNLSELTNLPTARTNLGLGTAAVKNTGTSGDAVGLLNGNNTTSGNNAHTGTETFTGAVSLNGTENHRLTAVPTALTSDSIGFRGAPAVTQDADYTYVLADSGGLKVHTSGSGHTYTLPLNASVAYPLGTIMLVVNIGAGAVTIARTGGVTLRRAGVATDANASIAQWGFATMIKIDTNVWAISGTGVS